VAKKHAFPVLSFCTSTNSTRLHSIITNSTQFHTNSTGNGFLEKICTKANNNARQDLYAAQGRASVGLGKVDRIKRRSEDAYENDKYIRINSVKHRSKMALDTDALMVSHPCPLDDQNISTEFSFLFREPPS
jgi:hypothetical protein